MLRLLFSSFRAGQIEGSTAPLVKRQSVVNSVRRIEASMRQHVQDAVLHDGARLSDKFRDDLSLRLWDQYCDLASSQIGSGARAELRGKRSEVPHVILLGQRPTPVEYGAAPYHRLLIALCIEFGWVTYHQVTATSVSYEAWEVIVDGGKPIRSK